MLWIDLIYHSLSCGYAAADRKRQSILVHTLILRSCCGCKEGTLCSERLSLLVCKWRAHVKMKEGSQLNSDSLNSLGDYSLSYQTSFNPLKCLVRHPQLLSPLFGILHLLLLNAGWTHDIKINISINRCLCIIAEEQLLLLIEISLDNLNIN